MASEKEPQSDSQPRAVGKTVAEKYADVTLRLVEDHGDDFGPLTPEKEKKLRRKLYLHVMVLVSAINFMLFVGDTIPRKRIYCSRYSGRQIYVRLRGNSGAFHGDWHFETSVQQFEHILLCRYAQSQSPGLCLALATLNNLQATSRPNGRATTLCNVYLSARQLPFSFLGGLSSCCCIAWR